MERAETPGTIDLDEVRRLMARATGDEKHDESSTSTLDALAVLYGSVLRVDPANPDRPERDRFILSKGHGPVAYYAILAHLGFFPDVVARRLHGLGRQAREPPRPRARTGRRGVDRLARPRPADVGRRRARAPRRGPARSNAWSSSPATPS